MYIDVALSKPPFHKGASQRRRECKILSMREAPKNQKIGEKMKDKIILKLLVKLFSRYFNYIEIYFSQDGKENVEAILGALNEEKLQEAIGNSKLEINRGVGQSGKPHGLGP